MNNSNDQEAVEGIAIIGMSGRFPGAGNIDQFWNNLKDGVESITYFSKEDARASGINEDIINDPNYVFAGGVLEDVELFDAGFFGFNPQEAATMDPQQRLFLECAYEALENAGYAGNQYDIPVGVYAGANMSTYFLYHLFRQVGICDDFSLAIANDKDYIATRVSYELNFKGPSITVQTACSTSMTAVAMACEGLLNYHCDMALAGGAAVKLPQKMGYLYQPGMIVSPDGHTRPFDEDAQGTVFTSVVGVVVLKRLEDALKDGDSIYAVIKGIAVNNDGSDKVGFTAPSREGQAEVIAAAQNLAGINPEDVGYIETHGTGTSLGDPIEIGALMSVFKRTTEKKAFCAVGSVKSNIGHAVSGSGVAGLIKTVLALKHKQIPPSINFRYPNSKIDFESSAFYINNRLTDWQSNGKPRIAGISSFGFGGTNVHAILEEAPPIQRFPPSKAWQILTISAKTRDALEKTCFNLADFFRKHREVDFSDAVYTLHVGRKEFQYRRAILCRDLDDAIRLLTAEPGNPAVFSGIAGEKNKMDSEISGIIAAMDSDTEYRMAELAKHWVNGTFVDWKLFHQQEKRLRIPLPTYPFERKRHWVEQYPVKDLTIPDFKARDGQGDFHGWLYHFSWKRATSLLFDVNKMDKNESWLIFADERHFDNQFIEFLEKENIPVVKVGKGGQFAKINEAVFSINPGKKEDYQALIGALIGTGKIPRKIVHLWSVTGDRQGLSKLEFCDQCQENGFFSLLYLAQALGEFEVRERLRIVAITNNLHWIAAEKDSYPEKATILGVCKVIPKEYPGISCQSIDITLPETPGTTFQRLIGNILAEISEKEPEFIVALRGSTRWIQTFEKLKLEAEYNTCLDREEAVYLITGGMGGIGLAIARYMASKAKVKLVLTGRSFFPEKKDWNRWVAAHGEQEKISAKIRQLMAMEGMGSEIMVVNADISELEQMRKVVSRVRGEFGAINGVIHAAGIADNELISQKSHQTASKVLLPKVRGTLVLDELFKEEKLDFMVLFSSSSAILGNAGFVDYCAANNFLDAYAQQRNNFADTYTVSVNWDEWDEVGMAAESQSRDRVKNKVTVKEGLALLDRIVAFKPAAQVIVTPGNLLDMLEDIKTYLHASLDGQSGLTHEGIMENNRPDLATPLENPRNETEALIVEIWQKLLGIYPIGIHDDFFELGGHSLLAVTLLSELAKGFHRSISLQDFFERATVAQLAEMFRVPEETADEEGAGEYEEGQI